MYSENWLHCGQLQYMYHMCMYIVFTVVHCTLCDLIKKLGATHLSYYAATRHSSGWTTVQLCNFKLFSLEIALYFDGNIFCFSYQLLLVRE